jgi:hypothetical protein
MRRLKRSIMYESFIGVLENFPDIYESRKEILDAVQTAAGRDFTRAQDDEQNADWGIIHGDFWTGK